MFLSSESFESALVSATRREFRSDAQILSQQRLWTERTNQWTVDLLCLPATGRHAEAPHVVEFKYVRTRTVPSAILVAALERFERIELANPGVGIRFAFVTNGDINRKFLGDPVPRNVLLVARVDAVEDWLDAARQWMAIK